MPAEPPASRMGVVAARAAGNRSAAQSFDRSGLPSNRARGARRAGLLVALWRPRGPGGKVERTVRVGENRNVRQGFGLRPVGRALSSLLGRRGTWGARIR